MRNVILLTVLLAISITAGVWLSHKIQVHYFVEQYYHIENLEASNEGHTDGIRNDIEKLIEKVPLRYRPESQTLQCFKIISEPVFFCSADTYRKHCADELKRLFQVTIANEIGWIPQEDVEEQASNLRQQLDSNTRLIAEQSKRLDKINSQSRKNSFDEKKFLKVNELYKRNQDLFQKKIELLQNILSHIGNPSLKDGYQSRLEATQAQLETLNTEYHDFQNKNKGFAQSAEQRDVLQDQITKTKVENDEIQKELQSVKEVLSKPNSIGRVADPHSPHLVADPSRQKFEVEYRPINAIWFSILAFFILSNIAYAFPRRPKPIMQEDLTMNEAQLK